MSPLSAPQTTFGLTALQINEPEKLSSAAKQFEAIFLRQMLAAARKTEFRDDLFGSEGLDTFRQMQDENFADIAAQTGSLGLASMIEAQLSRYLPQTEE